MIRLVLTWAIVALAVQSTIAPVVAADEPVQDVYRRGRQAYRAGDFTTALAAFEQVVKLEPGNPRGWLELGRARSAVQDGTGAIAAYRQVLEIDPRHVKALNNLGNIHFRRGEYEEAAGWYRQALDIDPGYLLAAFHYGWIQRHLNHPEEAESWFRRCVESTAKTDGERSTRLQCLFYVGSLRFRAGDHAQAASVMEQVLSLQPDNVEAHYYLGMSYRHLGRMDEAREQLELHRQLLRESRSSAPIEPERP